jgi:tetratricopeptide (TPR) repeat protein
MKMNRVTDVPNISKEMKIIYGKFMDSGSFEDVLPHIDAFLEKYPNYTEALVFKARALMALGRNNEALKCLNMAKRADKWRLIGRFDEAEIYLEKKKTEHSIKKYVEAVEAYATELKNGIDGYFLCCNPETRERFAELTRSALTEFFLRDTENTPFENLLAEVSKIKDELEYT